MRNFLLASALHWVREFHVDGLRVDAVASMLYLDYSRKAGEWIPNAHGGRENLDAVEFLRELNDVVARRRAGRVRRRRGVDRVAGRVAAGRTTAASGFGFKWNMGWMHDTLEYFAREPDPPALPPPRADVRMVYAYSEHYVLPLSHDEVVHGKRSLLGRMPGDRWQQLANLRALYAYMWAHPGKKLLFMGGELAPGARVGPRARARLGPARRSRPRAASQTLVRDLNRPYRAEPALWTGRRRAARRSAGSTANDADHNVFAFVAPRSAGGGGPWCASRTSRRCRATSYRVGAPARGRGRSSSTPTPRYYGGSDVGNGGGVDGGAADGRASRSAELVLPPLGVLWLAPTRREPATRELARSAPIRRAAATSTFTRLGAATRELVELVTEARRASRSRAAPTTARGPSPGRGGARRPLPLPARRRRDAPRPVLALRSRRASAGRRAVVDPGAFALDRRAVARRRARRARALRAARRHVHAPTGTFDAAVDAPAELVELGVTAIELMPVATFPGQLRLGLRRRCTRRRRTASTAARGLARLVDAAHAAGSA